MVTFPWYFSNYLPTIFEFIITIWLNNKHSLHMSDMLIKTHSQQYNVSNYKLVNI